MPEGKITQLDPETNEPIVEKKSDLRDALITAAEARSIAADSFRKNFLVALREHIYKGYSNMEALVENFDSSAVDALVEELKEAGYDARVERQSRGGQRAARFLLINF